MIPLPFFTDRPVAVLGLGLSGVATAKALAASGGECWAWDDSTAVRVRAAGEGINLRDLSACDLAPVAALVLSPGIPHTHPAPHPIVARARDAGCPVIGDGELLVRSQPDATYVGITGTNGKSTTTALIGHVLASAGRRCEVGGNLGTPMLALRPLGRGGIYVLEMSSYQLELVPSMVFDVAVLLNISADHLDRHGGMPGYVAAKRRIFDGQTAAASAVIGVDDEHCRAIRANFTAGAGPRVIGISGTQAVDGGVYAADGRLFDGGFDEDAEPVFDLAEAPALPGSHNAQNAAAAFAAARALGVDRDDIRAGLRTFPGLPHRQQRIAEIRHVLYVNDSKATNADAAARALACYQTIYWIAGGRAKAGGLTATDPYLDRVRHAFLIGEAAERFARELEGRVPLSRCETLERAIVMAREMAERDAAPGAVVLLSPACASFDQFANFEARGDAFRALVEGLPS